MAVIPYTDWSPVSQLREEINRLFGNMDKGDTSGATASWIPAVDIYEYDNRFELKVDLPGVDPKDVEMTLDRGVLEIKIEKQAKAQPKRIKVA